MSPSAAGIYMLVNTWCQKWYIFTFSFQLVQFCVFTRLFLLWSTYCITGAAFPSRLQSPDTNSERREIRGNQRAHWRHNKNAGCSWFWSFHSTSFAFLTLSIHGAAKLMCRCTWGTKCAYYRDSGGCQIDPLWTGTSRSGYMHIKNRLHQRSLVSVPRPPLHKGLSTAVLVSTLMWLLCSHWAK